MNRMFLGKIVLASVAVSLEMSELGIVFMLCLGHLLDLSYPHLINRSLRLLDYQKFSEKLLFVLAYSTEILGIDRKKAFSVIKEECIISNKELEIAEGIFLYYCNIMREAITKLNKNKKWKKEDKVFHEVDKAFGDLVRHKEDSFMIFRIIESISEKSGGGASNAEVKILKEIASLLNINYVRADEQVYEYNRKEHEPEKEESQPNSYSNDHSANYHKEESVGNISNVLTSDIIGAFAVLGIQEGEIPDMSMAEVKKNYRKKVKEYHPDFNGGDGGKDKINLEKKLVDINKSMDIIKNYLDKA